jgi:thiol-disulfide isomerase/thioredoxin
VLDDEAWSVGTRVGYTFVPYGRLQQGTDTAPNPNELGIDVHLGTLQATAAAPTGTGLDLQLPFGSLVTRSIMERRTDSGIGDLELRVRQSLNRFVHVRRVGLGLAAGAVVPTGPYVARAGEANLAPEASYLTLGRGVPWWIVEADVRVELHRRVALFAQLSGRRPLARASDEFAWGAEARTTIGARFELTPRLAVVTTGDVQWRGGASEPDPFSDGRLVSANAGGWQGTVSAAGAASLTSELALIIGLRLPVVSDVTGNQLVPQLGGFAALSFTHRIARRRTPPRIEPAAGVITVVDYWATWCAPCVEISRALELAAKRWPDVRIVSIDATRWPAEDAPQLPAEATGLPVIELFDQHGTRRLLLGPEALRVVEEVDALRTPKKRPVTP